MGNRTMSVATEEYVFDELDRDAGSGSLGEREAEEGSGEPYTHEQIDERNTGFNPNDADNQQRVRRYDEEYDKWEWLNLFDSGVRDTNRKAQKQADDQERSIEIFGSQLEMTDYQIDRTKHLYENEVDMKAYRGKYSHEAVVLALLSLVQNTEVTEWGRDVRDTEMWSRLMIELNVEYRDISKLRGQFHDLL